MFFVVTLTNMSDILSDQNNSKMNSIFDESGKQAFSFIGFDGRHSSIIPFLQKLVRLLDIGLVILFIFGLLYMIYSNLGDSGDAKWRGASLILYSYIAMLVFHIFLTALCSYSGLSGGKIRAFLFLALSEAVLMAGSIILYLYGAIYKQIYMMTGRESYSRKATRSFKTMTYAILGSGIAAVFGVFLG